MDKIKKAIERARAAETEGGSARPVDEPKEQSPRAERSKAKEFETDIKYSKTRVVTRDDRALARNRIVLGLENDEATTAYKILRTQVEQRLAAKGWNSVAITSPAAAQGKTLTAINLSIALAREMHRTVLLVDLDLRNPSVHRYFALEPTLGLVDYLLDDVPVSDLLLNPGIERLVLLPSNRPVPNSSELISSPKMVRLVEELKTRYPSRIIVFDLPPLLAADDTLAFAPYVDSTILVIEDGRTVRDDILRSMEMLQGIQLLGTVLNKAKEVQPVYKYR